MNLDPPSDMMDLLYPGNLAVGKVETQTWTEVTGLADDLMMSSHEKSLKLWEFILWGTWTSGPTAEMLHHRPRIHPSASRWRQNKSEDSKTSWNLVVLTYFNLITLIFFYFTSSLLYLFDTCIYKLCRFRLFSSYRLWAGHCVTGCCIRAKAAHFKSIFLQSDRKIPPRLIIRNQ